MENEKEQWEELEELYEALVDDGYFKSLDMPEEVPQVIKQAIAIVYEKGWEDGYDFSHLDID